MDIITENNIVNPVAAIKAVGETLMYIDYRLVHHSKRVAYIAEELNKSGNLGLDKKTLYLLCVFHDIGAYKTDDINQIVQFETQNVSCHCIYGYLFLKHFTHLSKHAKVVLHHHSPWTLQQEELKDLALYGATINLADRIDILFLNGINQNHLDWILKNEKELFCPTLIETLNKNNRIEGIVESLKNEKWIDENEKLIQALHISKEESFEFLKLLVYLIDFSSKYTVTHSINTVSISVNIAEYFKLSEEMIYKIYLGALLHDVGKMAVPIEILESPNKLTENEMAIMRTHVLATERLIKNVVSKDICKMAIRHHEKLDGTGYPYGILAEELTFAERIIGVADIVSALSTSRSYKEPFPKEKICRMLNDMKQNVLDEEICNYIVANYDEIMVATQKDRIAIIETYHKIVGEFEELSGRKRT